MALTGNVPLSNFTIRHVPPPPRLQISWAGQGRRGSTLSNVNIGFQHGTCTSHFLILEGGPLSNFRIGHEPPIFKFLEGGGPLSNFKIGHEPPIFKFLEGGPPPKKKMKMGGSNFWRRGLPPPKEKNEDGGYMSNLERGRAPQKKN